MKIINIILFIFFLIPFVTAHGEVEDEHSEEGINQINLVYYTIIAILLIVILDHYYESKYGESEKVKKTLFGLIILIVVLSAGYILVSTIYSNITSFSKGPIHWHADLEIEICGEPYHLPQSEGLSNRVGSGTLHLHNDDRIHIEGVLKTREDGELGKFFDAIEVPFSETQIDGKKNEDLCPNGKAGRVHMYVNGKENFEFREYLIAPYPDVPPGDKIKITFE